MNTQQAHWVPEATTFDARLVLVRHSMGWNLKEAALACGLSPQSWREWELSARRPRDYEEVCNRIADRTGCSLVWLMTGSPNPDGLPPDGIGNPAQPPKVARHQQQSWIEVRRTNEAVDDDAAHYVALAEGRTANRHTTGITNKETTVLLSNVRRIIPRPAAIHKLRVLDAAICHRREVQPQLCG